MIRINLNAALEREVSVPTNLYNAGFLYALWVTYDVTKCDFCNMLKTRGMKRLKVVL